MRTGKALILATKAYANDDTARSWWALLSTMLGLALAMSGALFAGHWLAQLACSILTGLFGVRLFVIYHDHQHNAILAKSRIADILMTAWGLLATTPSSIWKHSHNYHHNHNCKLRSAHIGSYPVMTKKLYQSASRSDQRRYQIMRHPLTILFGYITVFLIGMCIIPFVSDPAHHRDCGLALLLHFLLYVVIGSLFGLNGILFLIVVPFTIAAALGSYLFYAQHNFPAVTFKEHKGWTYEGAALESSSFCRMSPLMHYFTANIGYHHLHHLNAKIPFYRLPEAFSLIPEVQHPKTTSLHPREILRCLRLKVWDSDLQRMTPLPKRE